MHSMSGVMRQAHGLTVKKSSSFRLILLAFDLLDHGSFDTGTPYPSAAGRKLDVGSPLLSA